MYSVYEALEEDMFAEMPTCLHSDDDRYLILDVARQRAGVNPQDTNNGLVPEVDTFLIETLLDFYYSLQAAKYKIRQMFDT